MLILGLWALFLLGALALAVTAHVSGAIEVSRRLKGRSTGDYLLRAGVVSAMAVGEADTNGWDAGNEAWANNPEAFCERSMEGGTWSLEAVRIDASGAAVTNFGLTDEDGRINLNRANRAILASALERIGGLAPGAAGEAAAAVIDWRDADDNAMPGGAEDAYYRGFGGYGCHNGPMDVEDELRLVRGISDAVFQRLRSSVTVHGGGRVNINTADAAVLTAVLAAAGNKGPAVGDRLAEKIVGLRSESVFTDRRQIVSSATRLDGDEREVLTQAVNMGLLDVRSTSFRGTVRGWSASGAAERSATFVWDRSTGNIRFWHEQ